jgi:hypothetical protein
MRYEPELLESNVRISFKKKFDKNLLPFKLFSIYIKGGQAYRTSELNMIILSISKASNKGGMNDTGVYVHGLHAADTG